MKQEYRRGDQDKKVLSCTLLMQAYTDMVNYTFKNAIKDTSNESSPFNLK